MTAALGFSTSRQVPPGAEVLAVPVLSGCRPAGQGAELDLDFLRARDFDGRPGQVEALLADDQGTVLAVGMGDPEALDAEAVRRAGAAVVGALGRATGVALTLLDAVPGSLDRAAAAQALAEGISLAAYRYGSHKRTAAACPLETVTVVTAAGATVQRGLDRGARVAAAVALARDLVNEPPGTMTPRHLEQVARRVADEGGLAVRVLDEADIVREGLGGLAGVAAGSDEPARLIELVYDPPGARATVALVGKGITFDSGGLSIKTSDGMMAMKCDMAGAAAVIAAMSAMPDLGVGVRVVGLAACTENLPSGRATKPGDVLTIRNSTTVEVLNTDAEGRLVLADALCLAAEARPDAIVDLATLTGACTVALGGEIAGLMGNSDALVDQLRAAADRAGEPVWPLPLPERYRRHLDSEVADLKNIGSGGGRAGALTAGLFLQEFVDGLPWAHLDIAGPAFRDEADSYLPKGGTGFGVRTVLELVTAFRRPGPRRRPGRR